MCDACEDWDAREPREPTTPPELVPIAREIERGMPGMRVTDAAWRIALGDASGAIAWADHLRILAAFQAAAATARPAFARRRRSTRLACAAAG